MFSLFYSFVVNSFKYKSIKLAVCVFMPINIIFMAVSFLLSVKSEKRLSLIFLKENEKNLIVANHIKRLSYILLFTCLSIFLTIAQFACFYVESKSILSYFPLSYGVGYILFQVGVEFLVYFLAFLEWGVKYFKIKEKKVNLEEDEIKPLNLKEVKDGELQFIQKEKREESVEGVQFESIFDKLSNAKLSLADEKRRDELILKTRYKIKDGTLSERAREEVSDNMTELLKIMARSNQYEKKVN